VRRLWGVRLVAEEHVVSWPASALALAVGNEDEDVDVKEASACRG